VISFCPPAAYNGCSDALRRGGCVWNLASLLGFAIKVETCCFFLPLIRRKSKSAFFPTKLKRCWLFPTYLQICFEISQIFSHCKKAMKKTQVSYDFLNLLNFVTAFTYRHFQF